MAAAGAAALVVGLVLFLGLGGAGAGAGAGGGAPPPGELYTRPWLELPRGRLLLGSEAKAKHFGFDRWLGPGFEAVCTSLDGPLCAAWGGPGAVPPEPGWAEGQLDGRAPKQLGWHHIELPKTRPGEPRRSKGEVLEEVLRNLNGGADVQFRVRGEAADPPPGWFKPPADVQEDLRRAFEEPEKEAGRGGQATDKEQLKHDVVARLNCALDEFRRNQEQEKKRQAEEERRQQQRRRAEGPGGQPDGLPVQGTPEWRALSVEEKKQIRRERLRRERLEAEAQAAQGEGEGEGEGEDWAEWAEKEAKNMKSEHGERTV